MEFTLGVWQAILLAHLLYDFHWQGDFIGVLKSKYDHLLLVHCATWALFLSFVLQFYGIFVAWKLVFLFITHYVIDYWKCHKPVDDQRKFTTWLYIDQGLHLITMWIVVQF